MGLFSTKKTISSPTLTAIKVGGAQVSLTGIEATFPGTQITVKKSDSFPSGNYMMIVLMHLQEIYERPLGRQLFQALGQSGKRQNIVYGGANTNQAAGSIMGYVQLRKYHEARNLGLFSGELTTTVNASGKGRPWIAAKLVDTRLPHWNGTSSASPFALNGTGPVAGAKAREKLDEWLAGSSLPTLDEMDILMLVMMPWLQPGPGVGTRISYDPNKVSSGGSTRPPPLALAHELVHAYYNAIGGQLGREDSVQESNGGRLFELMSSGLPPFNTATFGENQMRAAWPFAARNAYP